MTGGLSIGVLRVYKSFVFKEQDRVVRSDCAQRHWVKILFSYGPVREPRFELLAGLEVSVESVFAGVQEVRRWRTLEYAQFMAIRPSSGDHFFHGHTAQPSSI